MAKAKGSVGTEMVVWNERLAALAKGAVKMEAAVGGGGNFLSIKSGMLSYRKIACPENRMKAIILDFVLENQWYSQTFNPDNPSSPDCYAFGKDSKEMAPHESVEAPVNPTCLGCPNKEFGSAERGKGKACGDVQRLGLIPEEDLDNIAEGEIAYLKLPYFSTINWAAYVRELEEAYHLPPMAFITEISVVPDPKSQFRVTFKRVEQIQASPEVYKALWERHEEVAKSIAFPYPKFEAAEKPVAKGNGRGAPRAPRAPRAAPVNAAPVAASTSKTAVGLRRPVKAPKY